jgi:hypothetical protein
MESWKDNVSGFSRGNRNASFSDCALFLKPILDEDPNVETILYADSWYQKDKIIYNGKKEFVNKIINVESNFFFHSKLLVAMLFQQ